MLEADSRFGKFEFRPLEPGFGITVGNALRRILLSSLEGFAITTIKIDGVEHEFSSVPGVKEDVTNIILNLKQVRFKQVVEEFESEKVSITIENSSEFKAGDIGKYLTGFEVNASTSAGVARDSRKNQHRNRGKPKGLKQKMCIRDRPIRLIPTRSS